MGDSGQRIRRRAAGLALALLTIVAAGTAVATILGLLGAWSWQLDLFAHFRVQYAAVLALTAAGYAIGRKWRYAAAAAPFLGFNLAIIAPLYWSSAASTAATTPRIELISYNVHDHNERFDEVARFLRDSGADVIIVSELTSAWAERIGAALTGYQSLVDPRPDRFGIGMWWRIPATARTLELADAGVPSIELAFEFGGQPTVLLGVHTLPPVSSDHAQRRDAMLAAIGDWSAQREQRSIVIGDINATPWSHPFQQLVARGLVNSQRGHGIQASWPGGLWPLSIPIDHCLHDGSLVTVERSVGSFLGSDHRPLRVTLAPVGSP